MRLKAAPTPTDPSSVALGNAVIDALTPIDAAITQWIDERKGYRNYRVETLALDIEEALRMARNLIGAYIDTDLRDAV